MKIKGKLFSAMTSVVCVGMLFTNTVHSGPREFGKPIKHTIQSAKNIYTSKLPDLVVSDIRLVKDCKIKITIKNIGNSGVPNSGYNMQNGAAIQMYKGNQAWGGIRLGAIDSGKKLQQPGGTVSYIWFPNAANLDLGPGIHSIKLVVDNNNAVTESNEKNNTLTKRLGCNNGKPDLIVSNIQFTDNCLINYTIKNVGTAGVPASAYSNTNKQFLQFYDGNKFMGGISLQATDPSNQLQTPGGSAVGTSYPGNYTPAGPHNIKIIVDTINIVGESNENNNSKILNQTCKPK